MSVHLLHPEDVAMPEPEPERPVHPRVHDIDLVMRSIELWPGSLYLQREWVHAVSVVRATGNGWLLETKR
jgi:hypothetical protein